MRIITIFSIILSLTNASATAQSVFAKVYPERVDDLAWENEYAIYRIYGPALQRNGERAFGIDTWTKTTPEIQAPERYRMELKEHKSYHTDWGKGMDCYSVGPTLGCGTPALLLNGEIQYPWAYKTCEIIKNGPDTLEFSATYDAIVIRRGGLEETVTPHLKISTHKGTRWNKIEVTYSGLTSPIDMAVGIVLHPRNISDSLLVRPDKHLIAYADPTDRPNNGAIYVGVYMPDDFEARVQLFSKDDAKNHPGASGHILAVRKYHPGQTVTYYMGTGWSKGNCKSLKDMEKELLEIGE